MRTIIVLCHRDVVGINTLMTASYYNDRGYISTMIECRNVGAYRTRNIGHYVVLIGKEMRLAAKKLTAVKSKALLT